MAFALALALTLLLAYNLICQFLLNWSQKCFKKTCHEGQKPISWQKLSPQIACTSIYIHTGLKKLENIHF